MCRFQRRNQVQQTDLVLKILKSTNQILHPRLIVNNLKQHSKHYITVLKTDSLVLGNLTCFEEGREGVKA